MHNLRKDWKIEDHFGFNCVFRFRSCQTVEDRARLWLRHEHLFMHHLRLDFGCFSHKVRILQVFVCVEDGCPCSFCRLKFWVLLNRSFNWWVVGSLIRICRASVSWVWKSSAFGSVSWNLRNFQVYGSRMSNVQSAGWNWSLLDSLILFWVLNIRSWESFDLVGSVRWVKIGFRFWLLFLGVWEIYKFMGRRCPIFNLRAEFWVCWIEIFNCCHLGSLIRMWRALVKLGLWGELGRAQFLDPFVEILESWKCMGRGCAMFILETEIWVHSIGIFS